MIVSFCPYEGSIGIERGRLLRLVKEAGYDGVEIQLGVSYGKSMIDDYDQRDWADLKKQLKNFGLASPTIMTPPWWPLTHPSYTELAQGLMRHYVNAATYFDAKVVGTWPNIPKGIAKQQALETMRENLLAVLPYADKADISLALEFEPGEGVLGDHKEAEKFIRETDGRLRIIYDTHHVYNLKEDPYNDVIALKDLISMVHFSDSERLLPGKGQFDFAAFYRALKEINYTGSVDVVFSCSAESEVKESRDFIANLDRNTGQH
jgi:sugar phosphate isomerase/epimerase